MTPLTTDILVVSVLFKDALNEFGATLDSISLNTTLLVLEYIPWLKCDTLIRFPENSPPVDCAVVIV